MAHLVVQEQVRLFVAREVIGYPSAIVTTLPSRLSRAVQRKQVRKIVNIGGSSAAVHMLPTPGLGCSVNVDGNCLLSPLACQGFTGNYLRLVAEVLLEHPFEETGVRSSNFVNRFAAVVAKGKDDHAVLTPHELPVRVHDVGILHSGVEFRYRAGKVFITLHLAVQDQQSRQNVSLSPVGTLVFHPAIELQCRLEVSGLSPVEDSEETGWVMILTVSTKDP